VPDLLAAQLSASQRGALTVILTVEQVGAIDTSGTRPDRYTMASGKVAAMVDDGTAIVIGDYVSVLTVGNESLGLGKIRNT